jgi:hypothetical protein
MHFFAATCKEFRTESRVIYITVDMWAWSAFYSTLSLRNTDRFKNYSYHTILNYCISHSLPGANNQFFKQNKLFKAKHTSGISPLKLAHACLLNLAEISVFLKFNFLKRIHTCKTVRQQCLLWLPNYRRKKDDNHGCENERNMKYHEKCRQNKCPEWTNPQLTKILNSTSLDKNSSQLERASQN